MIKLNKMLKLGILLSSSLLFANNNEANTKYTSFGADLFNGSFTENNIHIYNPNYVFNVGDEIELKFWGAINETHNLTIDNNGMIFIPNMGVVKLVGTLNKDLYKNIDVLVKEKYKKNVFFYANINAYTPINIFISGAVKKPGLYKGLSNDSILQYIDKAQGIKENGSYRKIEILRNNKPIKEIDLYSYLLNGKLEPIQFKSGDVINIKYLDSYILTDGELEKPLKIELKEKSTSLEKVKKFLNLNEGVSNVIIKRVFQNKQYSKMYDIADNIMLTDKNILTFLKSQKNNNIKVKISGEHESLTSLVVEKGTSLEEIISKIDFSRISAKKDIILYRKNIAKKQKELINSSLDSLERKVLQTSSSTIEEANIRKSENALVLDFIKKARNIETKGQVVLSNNTDLDSIILEEGDEIYIPKVSNIINVSGAVQVPTSMTYVNNLNIEDYIDKCGGQTEDAMENEVLIIKLNGEVIKHKYKESSGFFASNDNISSLDIEPGDSILVPSKIDTKDMMITKDISQILYQLAVSAGVLLTL